MCDINIIIEIKQHKNKMAGQGEVFKIYFFPKSYVSYRKPRAVSTEQRERVRQMMIANNKAKGD